MFFSPRSPGTILKIKIISPMSKKAERLAELIHQGTDLSAIECIEKALLSVPLHGNRTDDGRKYWYLEQKAGAPVYWTYGDASRARYSKALDLATRWNDGNLAGLVRYGDRRMPALMLLLAKARLRAAKGQPRRKGWKWSDEARAKLSRLRKASPSPPKGKGEIPRAWYDAAGNLRFPDNPAAVSEIRISGRDFARLLLPEGME